MAPHWAWSGGWRSGIATRPRTGGFAGEVVEAGAVGIYLGTHFLLPQISPDGLGGWVDQPEVPISADPQNIDATGHIGEVHARLHYDWRRGADYPMVECGRDLGVGMTAVRSCTS